MTRLDTSILKPGDVVIVEMGIWIIRWLIWLHAAITGRLPYSKGGHIIVVSHRDDEGRLWGIEGRPGGIGWTLLDDRADSWGLSNAEQPKTDEDRQFIVNTMQQLLGTRYDYEAYLAIALTTLGITHRWTDFNGEDIPVSFICSAVADWVYEECGLPSPGGMTETRFVTPPMWMSFVIKKEWQNV